MAETGVYPKNSHRQGARCVKKGGGQQGPQETCFPRLGRETRDLVVGGPVSLGDHHEHQVVANNPIRPHERNHVPSGNLGAAIQVPGCGPVGCVAEEQIGWGGFFLQKRDEY